MTTAEVQALITGIKSLNVADGKIDAVELTEVLEGLLDYNFGSTKTFSTAIDFIDSLSVLTHSVTANITFTRVTTGALIGATNIVRLTANGTNTVSFDAAFKKSIGSQSYSNVNTVVNVIYFWYDGVDYWYTIDRAA
jgi:hypothetical protein